MDERGPEFYDPSVIMICKDTDEGYFPIPEIEEMKGYVDSGHSDLG